MVTFRLNIDLEALAQIALVSGFAGESWITCFKLPIRPGGRLNDAAAGNGIRQCGKTRLL